MLRCDTISIGYDSGFLLLFLLLLGIFFTDAESVGPLLLLLDGVLL